MLMRCPSPVRRRGGATASAAGTGRRARRRRSSAQPRRRAGRVTALGVSGWGQFGPWSARVGYDPLVQAASGMMAINGDPERTATRLAPPTWLCDDLGGVHAALSALAALRHRDATGEGQRIDISMLDVVLFQSNGYLTLGAVGVELEPWGAALQFCVPGNAYQCADGRYVYTGALLNSHWARFCELMGRPELTDAPGFADNSERVANRESVDGLVAQWCAASSPGAASPSSRTNGLAATLVNTYEDLAQRGPRGRAGHAGRGGAVRRHQGAPDRPGRQVQPHADLDPAARPCAGRAQRGGPRRGRRADRAITSSCASTGSPDEGGRRSATKATLDAVAPASAAAERDGYDGVFVPETIHDPFVLLALAAQATDRVELGTKVAIALRPQPHGARLHRQRHPGAVRPAVSCWVSAPRSAPTSCAASPCRGPARRPACGSTSWRCGRSGTPGTTGRELSLPR